MVASIMKCEQNQIGTTGILSFSADCDKSTSSPSSMSHVSIVRRSELISHKLTSAYFVCEFPCMRIFCTRSGFIADRQTVEEKNK